MFRSDRGSVYTSRTYGELCGRHGIVQSMGSRSNEPSGVNSSFKGGIIKGYSSVRLMPSDSASVRILGGSAPNGDHRTSRRSPHTRSDAELGAIRSCCRARTGAYEHAVKALAASADL